MLIVNNYDELSIHKFGLLQIALDTMLQNANLITITNNYSLFISIIVVVLFERTSVVSYHLFIKTL